jgi:hypothetical protein
MPDMCVVDLLKHARRVLLLAHDTPPQIETTNLENTSTWKAPSRRYSRMSAFQTPEADLMTEKTLPLC